jgi:hypothetical protein
MLLILPENRASDQDHEYDQEQEQEEESLAR